MQPEVGEEGRVGVSTDDIIQQDLVEQPFGEAIVRVEVLKNRIDRVTVNDAPLGNLTSPVANRRLTHEEYQGEFGVTCTASSCIFREARVKFQ